MIIEFDIEPVEPNRLIFEKLKLTKFAHLIVTGGRVTSRFVNKTVIVTGASEGVGAAAAELFHDEIGVDDLEQIVNVNLKAPIVMTKLALPHLLKSRGAIVNVASLAGIIPMPDEATYCATKFGLRGFSFSLAEELRETGVTVSTVAPGPIETGFILTDLEKVPDYVFSQPMSTAEQVADLILDCAADGRLERAIPKNSARLAAIGFHLPALTKLLRPLLNKKGARIKKRYIDRKR